MYTYEDVRKEFDEHHALDVGEDGAMVCMADSVEHALQKFKLQITEVGGDTYAEDLTTDDIGVTFIYLTNQLPPDDEGRLRLEKNDCDWYVELHREKSELEVWHYDPS